jgi:ferredoxin/glyoxylase-like metal-dependent hydrolase (beta-lactamase superfamily II)
MATNRTNKASRSQSLVVAAVVLTSVLLQISDAFENSRLRRPQRTVAKIAKVDLQGVKAEPPPKTKQTKLTRRPQNVPGNFYVTEGCINCGACTWIAPGTFASTGFKTLVATQPSGGEIRQAVHAMVSCPSGSIQTEHPIPEMSSMVLDFPISVDEVRLPGVYHLGHHQHETFGATPYLIVREAGNFMVDLPRYDATLADSIEKKFGPVEYVVFTSRGMESGHEAWKARFPNLVRIMHRHDLSKGTLGVVEQSLDGLGPWELDSVAADLRIMHVPGRTYGSLCVWCQPSLGASDAPASDAPASDAPASDAPASDAPASDAPASDAPVGQAQRGEAALFSGATLGHDRKRQRLDGYAGMNKAGLERQAASVRELSDPKVTTPWQWLLPAYGARVRFHDAASAQRAAIEAADRLETKPVVGPLRIV